MLSQVSRNVGFMFRETGQAMDKLGCSIMGDYAFMEQREWRRAHPHPAERVSIGLTLACTPSLAGAGAGAGGSLWVCAQRLTICVPLRCAVSRHRKVMAIYDVAPVVGEGAFVAPSATVIGDVSLGAGSSVWYGAVLRGASADFSKNSRQSACAGRRAGRA